MISMGVYYGGPEQLPIEKLLRATMKAIMSARGEGYESHQQPGVNVVFYIPGSINDYADLKKIEAARYSRKQKLLLVAVPVSREEAELGGSVEFVIESLHQANAIAAETFARKGGEPFDLARAETIVEQVKRSLIDHAL